MMDEKQKSKFLRRLNNCEKLQERKQKYQREVERTPEILEVLEKMGIAPMERIYTEEFLEKILKKIDIKDIKEQNRFKDVIKHCGQKYIYLKRINPPRLRPHEQKKLLNNFAKSLRASAELLKAINKCVPTSGRYIEALREKYDSLNGDENAGMREMFEPYCNQGGMATTLFENFLEEIAQIAINAKQVEIKNNDSELTKEYLCQWISILGRKWPKSSSITFALGKYDQTEKIYTSPCIPILFELIHAIESEVDEKYIQTLLRDVINKGLTHQYVAGFLI